MINIDEIKSYLANKKKTYVADVRIRPSDETVMLYVSQDRISPKAHSGLASLRQLNNLKKDIIQKFSRNAEVILFQNDAQKELESGFYQILNRKFGGQIVSLYISFRNQSVVDAFIEVANLTGQLQTEISKHFSSVLEDADFQLGSLSWRDSPADLPTVIALLRVIKVLQPVSITELIVEVQKSYSSVSDGWLNHKLDLLRKKGLVLRQKINNTYVLSGEALSVIPVGARRNSSDIERALALGRKKW
ncbi:MAG: hypothetical protein JSR32_02070 [Proteobacteria bacterium]|nr:hypothetical protein [Pseudomonadota bacterium]